MKADIRKLLGTDKLIIGEQEVRKALRTQSLAQVLVASNCARGVLEDLEHASRHAGAEFRQLDVPNEELGVYCKKPFNIMVLGIRA